MIPTEQPANELYTFGRTEGNTTFLLSEKFKLIAFPTTLLEPFLGCLAAGQSLRIHIEQAPEQDTKFQLERKTLSESISQAFTRTKPQVLQLVKITSNFANLKLTLSTNEDCNNGVQQDEIQRLLLANGKQVEWHSIDGPTLIQVRGLAPATKYEFVYIQRRLGKAPIVSAPLAVQTAQENDCSAMLLWISPREPQRILVQERANAQCIASTSSLNQQVTHAFIGTGSEQTLEADELRMLREWKITPLNACRIE